MDGWSVLAALKRDPSWAGVPVIMLSVVEDKNLGYALGAGDYLTSRWRSGAWWSVAQALRSRAAPGAGGRSDASNARFAAPDLEKDGWQVNGGRGRAAGPGGRRPGARRP